MLDTNIITQLQFKKYIVTLKNNINTLYFITSDYQPLNTFTK